MMVILSGGKDAQGSKIIKVFNSYFKITSNDFKIIKEFTLMV